MDLGTTEVEVDVEDILDSLDNDQLRGYIQSRNLRDVDGGYSAGYDLDSFSDENLFDLLCRIIRQWEHSRSTTAPSKDEIVNAVKDMLEFFSYKIGK